MKKTCFCISRLPSKTDYYYSQGKLVFMPMKQHNVCIDLTPQLKVHVNPKA